MNIDKVIEMIIDGKTFREIAEEFKVSLGKVHSFISKDEHSAPVRNALTISADSYSDMAEKVLKEAASNSSEMTRARELAQHYRWKAAKRNPRRYSEKLDVTTDGDKIHHPATPIDYSKLSTDVLLAIKDATRKDG